MLEKSVVMNFLTLKIISVISLNLFSFTMQIMKYFDCKLRKKKWNVIRNFTILLTCNDLLFGFYLTCIFIAQVQFSKLTTFYIHKWLSSPYCMILGIFYLFAMLNSILLLNLVSLCRLNVVKYPLSYKRCNVVTMRWLTLGLSAIVSICIGTFLGYHIIEKNNMMSSSTCSFLGEIKKSITVRVVTIITASGQIVNLFFLTVVYMMIMKELKKPSVLNKGNNNLERTVMIQSLLLGVINVLCWLPSSVIYTISLVLDTYPISMLTWNCILINPLNSLINPIIFCIFPLITKLILRNAQQIKNK